MRRDVKPIRRITAHLPSPPPQPHSVMAAVSAARALTARSSVAACVAPPLLVPAWGAVRSYFSSPQPTWTLDDLRAQVATRRGRNPASPAAKLGPGISEPERQPRNAAARYGVLIADNGTKVAACNHLYRHCYGAQRPYIAVNKHGSEVHVHLEPILGLGKEGARGCLSLPPAEALAAARSSIAATVAASGRQWWNKDDKPDVEEARKQGADGSNAGRPAPAGLGKSFVVYTQGRGQALDLAHQVYAAYCEAVGAATPADVRAQRKANAQRRKAKYFAKVARTAEALATAPVRHRNVPPQSLDGFMAALDKGQVDVEALPVQQPTS